MESEKKNLYIYNNRFRAIKMAASVSESVVTGRVRESASAAASIDRVHRTGIIRAYYTPCPRTECPDGVCVLTLVIWNSARLLHVLLADGRRCCVPAAFSMSVRFYYYLFFFPGEKDTAVHRMSIGGDSRRETRERPRQDEIGPDRIRRDNRLAARSNVR